jgi:ATP-dependent DNA helicase RecQ
VLKGEQKFELRKDPVRIKTKKAKLTIQKGRIAIEGEREHILSDVSEGELFEDLRALRMEIAKAQGLPPYVIFHDRTLKELIYVLPDTLEEMRNVSGIGQKKIEMYGEQFLEVIRQYRRKHGLETS